MPMCGFNRKMLEGLTALNEGLVEHGLLHRSEQNGESIEQGIKREISDMTRLLSELHRIDDAAKRTITEGIVKYAMGFYLIMRKHDVIDYKAVIEALGEYFRLMDDKYYAELEGRPDDMQELIKFLNDLKV
jgi:chromosomal replication initiation ATPase DnaA